ncbi:MAG: hypothetical protein HQ500_04895 [Flavobacteriales bacterium]|nr:hypothetical protein [Flavobacteriales bacterium]
MKTLLTTLTLFVFTGVIFAQQYVDLIKVQHAHQLKNASGVFPGQSEYSATSLDFLLPVVISDKAVILTGIILEQTTLSKKQDVCSTIYGTSLKLGVNIKHSDKFIATYLLLPKISSNFKNTNKDHLQIGGVFLGKYILSPTFNVSFGVYGNREFFGPFIVPFAGFYLKKGDWELKATIPINAEVSRSFMEERMAVGLRFDGISRSYFLGDTDSYIEKANNEVGLFGQYKFGNIITRLTMGHSIGRSLRRFDAGDKADLALPLTKINNNRVETASISPNGIYTRISLIFRLPTS